MKYLLTVSITIIFGFQSVKAQFCSPNLIDIYDFEVGDQFYYQIVNENAGNGRPEYYTYYDTLEILEIKQHFDTLIIYQSHSDGSLDTMQFINDSLNIFNQCDSAMVLIQPYLYNYQNFDSIELYALLNIYTNDSGILVKGFDTRRTGYYTKNGTGDFSPYNDVCEALFLEFSSACGTYTRESICFEIAEHKRLYKKVRNGDTTALRKLNATPIQKGNSTLKVYPNPAKNAIYLMQTPEFNRYSIFNSLGENLSQGILYNNNPISISDLPPGMYNLHVHGDFESGYTRFIKE